MSAQDSLLLGRREARKKRTAELEKAGATPTQAFVMALEEAWAAEATENERLWDQADEILALKAEVLRLRKLLSPFAQSDVARNGGDGDIIGIYVRRGDVRTACKEFA